MEFEKIPETDHILQPMLMPDDDQVGKHTAKIPVVDIQLRQEIKKKKLLVVPWALKRFTDVILSKEKTSVVGSISVSYDIDYAEKSGFDSEFNFDPEFPLASNDNDNDNNNGNGNGTDPLLPTYRHDTKSFNIHQLEDNKEVLVVTIPSFINKLIYNLIAKKLLSLQSSLVALGTASLGIDGEPILSYSQGTGSSPELFKGIPVLTEHTVGFNGIAAALYNFAQNEPLPLCLLICNAAGAFIDDGERPLASVWPALALVGAQLGLAHQTNVAVQTWRSSISLYV